MPNSHKFDKVGGYLRYRQRAVFRSVWIRRLARGRCQIEGQRSIVDGTSRILRFKPLDAVIGVHHGTRAAFDSWSALRQPIAWVEALALLVRQSSWRRESLGPLLGVASKRLDTRTTVPSIAQLGSQRFPVMHWEFAKRTVNTSVVD